MAVPGYLESWKDASGDTVIGVDAVGQLVFGPRQRMSFTPDGGLAVRFFNKTGAPSVAGTLVTAASAEAGVALVTAGVPNCIGVVYESGVADGELVRVVIAGIARVLFADGQTPTVGWWVGSPGDGGANGRARTQESLPDNSGTGVTLHNHEIGHCLETKQAGTDVIARALLHFN